MAITRTSVSLVRMRRDRHVLAAATRWMMIRVSASSLLQVLIMMSPGQTWRTLSFQVTRMFVIMVSSFICFQREVLKQFFLITWIGEESFPSSKTMWDSCGTHHICASSWFWATSLWSRFSFDTVLKIPIPNNVELITATQLRSQVWIEHSHKMSWNVVQVGFGISECMRSPPSITIAPQDIRVQWEVRSPPWNNPMKADKKTEGPPTHN